MIKNPNVMGVMALAIIALAGTAIASASLLVQSASATDVMTNTPVGEEKETVNSTTTATDNVSSDPLGRLFMIVEFGEANVNPINATYIETSTVNNVTLILPDGNSINATEIANVTVSILPGGLAIDQGKSQIVIGGDDGAEQEIATTTFVDLARLNPDGSGSGTGVVFFSTNSTGQLAFLDGMVGINDSEFSPGTGTVRVWEWKGEALPTVNGGADSTDATYSRR